MSQKVYIICDKKTRVGCGCPFIYITDKKWKKLRGAGKGIDPEASLQMFGR